MSLNDDEPLGEEIILDLSIQELDKVPDNLDDDIESLDLSNNYIIDIEGVTFPSKLQILNLSNNSIESLKGVIFPPNLKHLYLDYNFDITNNDVRTNISLITNPKLQITPNQLHKHYELGRSDYLKNEREEKKQFEKSTKDVKAISKVDDLKKRAKKADVLLITYEQLCQNVNDNINVGQVRGLAKSLYIETSGLNKQEMCENIALKLILNRGYTPKVKKGKKSPLGTFGVPLSQIL